MTRPEEVRRGAKWHWCFPDGAWQRHPRNLFGPHVAETVVALDGGVRVEYAWHDPSECDGDPDRRRLGRWSGVGVKRPWDPVLWHQTADIHADYNRCGKLWLPTRMYIFGYKPGESCPWEGYWYSQERFWQRKGMARPGYLLRWFHHVYVHPALLTTEEWRQRTREGEFGAMVGWERLPRLRP